MATFVWRGNNRTWSDFSAAGFAGFADGTTVASGTGLSQANALPWNGGAAGSGATAGSSGASGPWNWYEVGFYDEGRNALEPAHRGSTKGCSFGLTHDIDSYWGVTSNWLLEIPGTSGGGSDVFYAPTSRVPMKNDTVVFKYVAKSSGNGLTYSIPLSPILFGGRGSSGGSGDVWVAQPGGFGGTFSDRLGALAECRVEPSYFTHDDPNDTENWGGTGSKFFYNGEGRGYAGKFRPATIGTGNAGGYRGGTWGFRFWGKSIADNQIDLFPNSNVNGNSAESGKLFWRGISLATEKLNVFGPNNHIPVDGQDTGFGVFAETEFLGLTGRMAHVPISKFTLYGLNNNNITNLYIRCAEFHFGSSSAFSVNDYYPLIQENPGLFIDELGKSIERRPDAMLADDGTTRFSKFRNEITVRNLTLTQVAISPIMLASIVKIGTETPQAITGLAYGPYFALCGADIKTTGITNVFRYPFGYTSPKPNHSAFSFGSLIQSFTPQDSDSDGKPPTARFDTPAFPAASLQNIRNDHSLTISGQNSTSPFSPVRTSITNLKYFAENTNFQSVSAKPITVSPGTLVGPFGNGVTAEDGTLLMDAFPRGFNNIVNVKSGCTVGNIEFEGGRFEVHADHPGGVSFASITGDQSVTIIKGTLRNLATIDQTQGPANFKAFVIGTAGGNTAGVKVVEEGAEVIVPADIFVRTSPESTVFSESSVSITSGYIGVPSFRHTTKSTP